MKYVKEYRDNELVAKLSSEIARVCKNNWTIMEVCGGQTHAIVKYGLQQLLPEKINLLHGPGCPVCVTPVQKIDAAIQLAALDNMILCTFGDMLRVPGSQQDLMTAKAAGGDVRIVSSPLDALQLAKDNPDRLVTFFAVGFETTAPANAMVAYLAKQRNITNFYLLVSHVLVPPALDFLLREEDCPVQGFLAAGHVCTVMGESAYYPLVEKYHVPIVITGFEPVDLLRGIYGCVQQLEQGKSSVENQYKRCVRVAGNEQAQTMMAQVFRVSDRAWRGIGEIKASGLEFTDQYKLLDASRLIAGTSWPAGECKNCLSGQVMTGRIKPNQCPAFANPCTPEVPLGAPMVSMEGACNAYYQFGGLQKDVLSNTVA